MTEIEYLKEQLEKADKFISQIENDYYPLIDEIIDTVCMNVIKRINTESKQINLCDDLPKEFTFFDQLSVLHQSRDYDEIFFPNGCLEDYIGNSIELEINELPRKDKIILWYSDCHSEFGNEYEVFDARYMCNQHFNDLQNKRYEELLPMLEECGF